MTQGFFRTENLTSCLKRLVSQYNILDSDHDFDADVDDETSRQYYNSVWPHSMGIGFSTKVEQCELTGAYCFNLQLTDEQVESLPDNDNPNFTFQYAGELNGEGVPLPLPTFMVEDIDINGVGLGTYHEQTICIQGV